jgi:hypothetical protein
MVDHIRFVQNYSDFIIVPSQRLDGATEFVRDVQFVGVEQQDDPVDALGEPLQDSREVVAAVYPLLLA